MNTVEIKQLFTRYFESMGYQGLPSASMLDPSIPMSFVMSAGLVQVENSLAKSTKRDGNSYILVQNCFRHFDLEKVGTDNIHLSYFEMPGAFTFGSEQKVDTVKRMWHLATSILRLPIGNLWATYFKGGKVLNDILPEDVITKEGWLETNIPPEHIIGMGAQGNFWIQGRGINDIDKQRKCGPNTELFFDQGVEKRCGNECLPGCPCGRFIEFSNSLFISSEITQEYGSIQPMSNPFTETVIGSERVAMISQKASSVFDTDSIKPFLSILHKHIHEPVQSEFLTSYERVIIDHIRGLYYLIKDGAPPPGKDGRARIVKMLIRRIAARLIILHVDPLPFLHDVLGYISDLAPQTPETKEAKERVMLFFLSEYERFKKTIQRGKLKIIQMLKENNGQPLSEFQLLELEKQWGVPSLLINTILKNRGLLFQGDDFKTISSETRRKAEFLSIGR